VTEPEVLHTDANGYRVLLYGEKKSGTKVIYERHGYDKYVYLEEGEAEAIILRGDYLRGYYIPKISTYGFYTALNEKEEYRKDSAVQITHHSLELDQVINIKECLINECDLEGIVIKVEPDQFALHFGYEHPDLVFNKSFYRPNHFFGQVNIAHALFVGVTDIRRAEFHKELHAFDTVFDGRTSFDESLFAESAFFTNAKFTNDASFSKCIFADGAIFIRSLFEQEVKFNKTHINGEADYGEATFEGKALFNGTVFSQKADFHWGNFNDFAGFSMAIFLADAYFSGSYFKNYCNFYCSIFHKLHLQNSHHDKNFTLTASSVDSLSLNQAFFAMNAILDFEDISKNVELIRWNYFSRMKKLNASASVRIKKGEKPLHLRERVEAENIVKIQQTIDLILKRGNVLSELDLENLIVNGELRCPFKHFDRNMRAGQPTLKAHKEAKSTHKKEDRIANWENARKQYAWLKEQYRKQGDYYDEDNSQWWASECRKESERRFLKKYFLRSFIYKRVLGYGVRPRNVIYTIIAVILGFTLIYWFGHSSLYPNNDFLHDTWWRQLANAFYFSVITFATVGYGDISPGNFLGFFAMLEGLFGVGLNAAFVVVLFRKIIR
jgi:Ion channel/Pentapeptide repeats (9 copies)